MVRVAQRAGCEIVITNSRGPQSLEAEVAALGTGVSAGMVDEAAAVPLVMGRHWHDTLQGILHGCLVNHTGYEVHTAWGHPKRDRTCRAP